MTKLTGHDVTLIELHKMAAECCDGLVPELLDTLRHGGAGLNERFDRNDDLVQARVSRAYPASSDNNVVAFPIAHGGVTRR